MAVGGREGSNQKVAYGQGMKNLQKRSQTSEAVEVVGVPRGGGGGCRGRERERGGDGSGYLSGEILQV